MPITFADYAMGAHVRRDDVRFIRRRWHWNQREKQRSLISSAVPAKKEATQRMKAWSGRTVD